MFTDISISCPSHEFLTLRAEYTVEASHYTDNIRLLNKTIALDKLPMSWLTFDFSTKVGHAELTSVYLNIFTKPIELKYNIDHRLYETMSKWICCLSHMAKWLLYSY